MTAIMVNTKNMKSMMTRINTTQMKKAPMFGAFFDIE